MTPICIIFVELNIFTEPQFPKMLLLFTKTISINVQFSPRQMRVWHNYKVHFETKQ